MGTRDDPVDPIEKRLLRFLAVLALLLDHRGAVCLVFPLDSGQRCAVACLPGMTETNGNRVEVYHQADAVEKGGRWRIVDGIRWVGTGHQGRCRILKEYISVKRLEGVKTKTDLRVLPRAGGVRSPCYGYDCGADSL